MAERSWPGIDWLVQVLRETDPSPKRFPIPVLLTDEHLQETAAAGAERQRITGSRKKDAHRLRKSGDPLQRHIQGCRSEKSVSLVTGYPWIPYVDDYREIGGNDVGPFGVRGTDLKDGSLILHERDDDDRVYILVIGDGAGQMLVGWIRGQDGKRKQFWRENVPSPAFFVPQKELHKDLPPDFYAWRSDPPPTL